MSKESEAQVVYNTLCSTLDNMKWTYNKQEENLEVRTSAVGNDLTMKLYMKVDANRSVMYLKSGMPFTVPTDRIDIMVKAVIAANWAMLNGSFEMDMSDGYIAFKVVVPFMESIISEKVCHYMINMSCRMIDVCVKLLGDYNYGFDTERRRTGNKKLGLRRTAGF